MRLVLLLWLFLAAAPGAEQAEFVLHTNPPGEVGVLLGDGQVYLKKSGEPFTITVPGDVTFWKVYYPTEAAPQVVDEVQLRPADIRSGSHRFTFNLSAVQWLVYYFQRYWWLVLLAFPVLVLAGRRISRRQPAPAATSAKPVSEVLGQYRIHSSLGSGGFGEVYAARDDKGQLVALKVLRPELQRDEAAVKRFFREIKILTQLQHPNIVHIYDWGEHDGEAYVAMEMLEGQTLAEIQREHGRLSAQTLLPLMPQLASALDALHSRDLVHRDIKPDNLFVHKGQRLKLMDFGATLSEDLTRATQTGQVLGTPAYMAPEQLRGEIVQASDQYALGVTFFLLLTGRKPFEGNDPLALAYAHVHHPPPAATSIAPDLPSTVDLVLGRMLAKNPRERYASAAEAIEALIAALRGPLNDDATYVG
jgi:serine/threonine protein kinase